MTGRNVKLVLEYDGTAYGGWQRQPNATTIQELVEAAVEKMVGTAVRVTGSGRTDAGVHARGQVASFRTDSDIPCEGFLRGLNTHLPHDVAVVHVEDAAPEFDARASARGKHYCYRVWNREARSPLEARTSWHVFRPLDAGAMQEAAAPLVGRHDFSAFRASDCTRKNPVREIRRVDVARESEYLIRIDVEATAFLKNMVRVIAGTLVEAGMGKRTAADVAAALASRDRGRAGPTAPACGLTLERVFY